MISKVSSTLTRPAIRVQQPLGNFYAFSVSADILNKITYSLPATVMRRLEQEEGETKGGYSIFGAQRKEKKTRLQEIASYIQTTDATFPNAIILAANYSQDDGLYIDESLQWTVKEQGDGLWNLQIPSLQPCASIIDGQHRLHAFQHLPDDAPEKEMELLCVVFLELPTPYHAYVFATINFNQKKVDRSLAYELFGFDVDERPADLWSPETLAVYLTRLLNTDEASPLYRSIFPAADSDVIFSKNAHGVGLVKVSMATVVDGILRILSKNPQEDRNIIRRPQNKDSGRNALTAVKELPLRDFYISGNDKAIYDSLCNYFAAVTSKVWQPAGYNSYLKKTVGIQAAFDILRELLALRPINAANYSIVALENLLAPCADLDPAGDKYEASGIGRSEIRRDLKQAIGLS
ncbi:DNA phosphorothioation-associated DGQHR protein 1 [Nitrosospira sp. Nsp2]|uniref:DNA phosphorothioation-associated DGQHR protein 1 n=1 Tax=Nitrosospira sp. Nsp2 TaxID=136548 RepID=UPI000D31D10E|nr:DNA phosphorothioation-associated DGQHR protein 1 [Nitrosospira sp. Nsp2]PTR16996.1 DNA phosphorothioation-associated DGQHR protein 1 [Nitrosospira sp. Nsp2]